MTIWENKQKSWLSGDDRVYECMQDLEHEVHRMYERIIALEKQVKELFDLLQKPK